jgi:GxxExxY protein
MICQGASSAVRSLCSTRSGLGSSKKSIKNALAYGLHAAGFAVVQQCSVTARYNDVLVGEYFADLLVENVLLVELKVVKALDDTHRMQCANYLKATGLRPCLLLNFGRSRLEIRRVVRDL